MKTDFHGEMNKRYITKTDWENTKTEHIMISITSLLIRLKIEREFPEDIWMQLNPKIIQDNSMASTSHQEIQTFKLPKRKDFTRCNRPWHRVNKPLYLITTQTFLFQTYQILPTSLDKSNPHWPERLKWTDLFLKRYVHPLSPKVVFPATKRRARHTTQQFQYAWHVKNISKLPRHLHYLVFKLRNIKIDFNFERIVTSIDKVCLKSRNHIRRLKQRDCRIYLLCLQYFSIISQSRSRVFKWACNMR